MKLSAKTNFDFGKLADALPEMISEIVFSAAKSSAEESRNVIKSGLTHPLKESTMQVRKLRGISGNTPLLATGALYDSIKAVHEGETSALYFKKYGQYHREGFTPPKIPIIKDDRLIFINNKESIEVPPRNFTKIGKLKTKNFQDKIIKALRK